MKVLGLILEINPFHNGHKHFIDEAIKATNPDVVIVVTSTSFTMRGEVSLLSKFDKTKILLEHNIDLVVELPVAKTLNSADYFGHYTVEILSQFGITDLAFGIENGRIDLLNRIFEISETPEFKERFAKSVRNKKSYKNMFLDVFSEVCDDDELLTYVSKPNFTLGLQYLKAIKHLGKDIKIHAVNRVDNFYNNTSSNFKSAYILREMLFRHEDISEYIPYNPNILKCYNKQALYNLIKFKFLIDNKDIKDNRMAIEGIENYVTQNLSGSNLDECLNNLCNKRYTKSRFMRLFISQLLDINKKYNVNEEYYRILGFNQKGRNYINSLPKTFKNKLKTSLKNETTETGIIELKATKLYSLLTNQDLLDLEFKIPIKIDTMIEEHKYD